jgi:hypothetical protein
MKGKNLGRRLFRRSKLNTVRVPAATSTVVVLHEPSQSLDEGREDDRPNAWLEATSRNYPGNLLSACFLPGIMPMEFSADTRSVIQECMYIH